MNQPSTSSTPPAQIGTGTLTIQDLDHPDNVTMEVKLDTSQEPPVGLQFTVKVKIYNDTFINVPVTVEEEDTYKLYELAHQAVANAHWVNEETQIQPRLPKPIGNYELVAPVSDPLILEFSGRGRVLDDRSEVDWRGEHRRYLPAVIIHLAECPKGSRATKYSIGTKTQVRTGAWEDVLPGVAIGTFVPQLCSTCKPLGPHCKAVNSRIAWSTFNVVPEEMPDHILGYEPTTNPDVKVKILHNLTTMTAARWTALADLIAWCARELGQLSPESTALESE